MFWNHIQHRRELYHFRLHWLLNTAKSRWLICLKRKTLTAPNRGPPLKTYVYLWSSKLLLLFFKYMSLLYTTSINAVIRLGVQKHHEFPSANWSWKPRHTFHQGTGPTCRSKARREIPLSSSPRKHSTHLALFDRHNQQPQRQSLLSLAKVTFLTNYTLDSPSNFTKKMSCSLRTLGHLLLHSSAQAQGHTCQQFSFYPKGQAGYSFPDNLLFRRQKLRLQRLS